MRSLILLLHIAFLCSCSGKEQATFYLGDDHDMSGNSFCQVISPKFTEVEFKKLYDQLNAPDFRTRLEKYANTTPIPKFEVSVEFQNEGPYKGRQIRMQMTPRLYRKDKGLEAGIQYLFEKMAADLDTGMPYRRTYTRSDGSTYDIDIESFVSKEPAPGHAPPGT